MRGLVASVELFLNSTVILNVFCKGLSKDTKPEIIGVVKPIVAKLVLIKFTHPIATWLVGPNLVLYLEPDENGRPDI